jgi:chromosome segregation ATPase
MSTSLEEIKSKVDELGKRYKVISTKKSNLNGLVQAKREELAALKKEIEDAGLDPKKLKEKRDELQTEVLAMMEDFERRLASVEEAFTAFETKK